ncbi:MAG: heparan-alpha-glucosaminide N-acetyltransferase [Patescibacteria group bacterium]
MYISSQHRYPEIDLLRTAAILGMIVYHTVYDLSEFYGWDIDPMRTGWWIFARSTAILFLLVSGASNTIANSRSETIWRRTLMRAGQILTAALVVTAATYFIDASTYIRFGILHCIAVSVFVLPLFRKFRQWNVPLGCLMIVLGYAAAEMHINTSLLLPLGLMPPNFASLDYFPLLPWFGVVLIGSAFADFLYIHKEFPGMRLPPFASALCSRVSHWSLIVYLVHQPIILLILMLMLGKPTF